MVGDLEDLERQAYARQAHLIVTNSHGVDIALVELPVAPLLGFVGPPYGLDLVAFEGSGNLGKVVGDETGEGNGQVVPEADPPLSPVCEVVDELLVFTVLTRQCLPVFDRRGLDGFEAVAFEDVPDQGNHVVPLEHRLRGEVSHPLVYGYSVIVHGVFLSISSDFPGWGGPGRET